MSDNIQDSGNCTGCFELNGLISDDEDNEIDINQRNKNVEDQSDDLNESNESLNNEQNLNANADASNNSLKYEFCQALRCTSKCLFTTEEKNMYLFHSNGKMGSRYVCYEKIKKNGTQCNAAVYILSNGTCVRAPKTFRHAIHEEHDKFKVECQVRQNVFDSCKNLKSILGDSVTRTNLRQIFRNVCEQ